MSWLRVTDPSAAARLVADSLVIHADPHARATNPYHWYRTQPLTERLARLAGDEDAAPFAPAARRLLAAPERPEHHRALVAALIPMIEKFPERMRPLTDLAWQTTQRGRIGHHLGAAVGPDAPPPRPSPPPPRCRSGRACRVRLPSWWCRSGTAAGAGSGCATCWPAWPRCATRTRCRAGTR
nr:hypothetical protein RKE32_13645 [Streptomyces sp. Li-HN-5-13]